MGALRRLIRRFQDEQGQTAFGDSKFFVSRHTLKPHVLRRRMGPSWIGRRVGRGARGSMQCAAAAR